MYQTVPDSDVRSEENNSECIKHCILIKNFRTRIRAISIELENERKCRDDQLSRVLRAFLFLEAKLRNEQKAIIQQMIEKDAVINEQYHEIRTMKEKYDMTISDGSSKANEEKENDDRDNNHIKNINELCSKCKKKFNVYKHFGTQTTNELNKLNNPGKVNDFLKKL